MKIQYGKKITKTIIIILAFVVVSIFAFILVRNQMFSPETYEKSNFTDKEVSIISDYTGIDLGKSNIDKGTFSHAKDSVFIFYVSNIQIDNIDAQFEKLYDSANDVTFQSKNNPKIKCIMNKNSDTAIIRIEGYNSKLYKMLKTS